MSIDFEAIHALPDSEKLQLVEMLWYDLGKSESPIPLPNWIKGEIDRRRAEMANPSVGVSHEETWRRIASRNG